MFYIKQGDTSPALQVSLRSQTNSPVVLVGASVMFHMGTENGKFEFSKPATIVNSTSGIVKYDWAAGDTSNTGIHFGEFEVTYSDNTIETFPNNDNIKIKITSRIS